VKKKPFKRYLLWAFLLWLAWDKEIQPTLRGEQPFILTRWLYARKDLKEKIPLEGYVLTIDQIAELFLYPDKEIVPLTNKELFASKKVRELVIRVPCQKYQVEGVIDYDINNIMIGKIAVHGLQCPPLYAEKYVYFISPVGTIFITQTAPPNEPAKVICKWDKLYVRE